jgi:hypothetical protein
MESKRMRTGLSSPAPRWRTRLRRACIAIVIVGGVVTIGSCGGGGGGGNGSPAAAPLTWDGPQATWDNVTWQ